MAKKAKKAVKKTKPVKQMKKAKPVKRPKPTMKPVKKAKPVLPKKVVKSRKSLQKRKVTRTTPKSLAQLAPHEAAQVSELLLPKHEETKQIPDWTMEPGHPAAPAAKPIEPEQPEKPVEKPAEKLIETPVIKQPVVDQPYVPVEAPAKGDFLLKVKLKKFFIKSVPNTEVLIMANERPFDRQVTDKDGAVYFRNLSAGDYKLAATIDGKFKTKPVTVKGLDSITFNV